MSQYIIKRFLTIVPVLVGISIIVFGFIHLIPGDPAVTMLGERATPERVKEVRAQLGLEKPLHVQYLIYAGKILQGDLGASILRGDPVLRDLIRRFPATVELALTAICFAILIGIPSGIISAVWRNSVFDGCSRIVALTGVSMPIFWLGLMLAWVFGVMLGWLPTGFRLGTSVTLEPVTHFNLLDSVITGNGAALVASVRHLILPALALSTIPMAVITRMTRASLLEVLSQDYIRTAESKGLPQRAVVSASRHAERAAPRHDGHGAAGGAAPGWGDTHRDHLLLAGDRPLDLRGHPGARLPHRAGCDALHCNDLRDGEPHHGLSVRHRGPADQV